MTMRVTDSISQSQFLTSIQALESSINDTQNQISSNKSFTTASQDPTAAGSVNDYTQALAQSEQFGTNASSAQTNLQTEDSTLSQVQNELNSLRTLTLEAGNGSLSSSDRTAIATQAVQIQNSLLALANTTNGNGEYIFGGYTAQTQPFTLTSTGARYNGDQGQRQVQIAAGQSVADGDNGDTVFNQIKTGNGTFQVTAESSNTGTGLIGATTLTGPANYVAGNFKITFSNGTNYTVTDSAVPPNTVSSGTYTDGSSITFNGQQITLSGTPNAGDTFDVSPSTGQSIFATVQNLVTALQAPASSASSASTAINNVLGNGINDIDQALDNISDVRASVGGRLNSITTQLSVAGTQQVQLQTSISQLQSLDYASALTTLTQQQTTLSAALQSFQLTQGLTLFKYL